MAFSWRNKPATGAAKLALVLLAVSLVPFAGCRDPNGRQSISGEITFDGQPLPSGQMSLRPFESGPSAAGRIKDGKFMLPADKGPVPGKYLVSIESMQPTGRTVGLTGTALKVEEMQQVVPDEYNAGSQLVIEVTGDGENHFDFELKKQQ
ncbi:MAG: hypothetical protein AAF266_05300 [Planctomycetota bacterium]